MNDTNIPVIDPVLSVLNRAPNEQWFSYHLDFNGLVVQYTPEKLGITALYPAHVEKVNTADVLLEQVSKSFYTAKMKTADTGRDDCITGMKMAVKAALKSADPDKKDAATRLDMMFGKYGNVPKMEYDAESAAIYNMLQDVDGKYAEDVKTLELTHWVTDLKRFNADFLALRNKRRTEKADKPDQTLEQVRREVDASLGNLLKVFEVVMMTNPDHGLEAFVKDLNILGKHHRTLFAQAQGRKNAKKTDTEE
jgi:hypothetical protein